MSLLLARLCLRKRRRSTLDRVQINIHGVEPADRRQRGILIGGDQRPGVTDEMPMRPAIGAVTVVQFRLMRALSSAAFFDSTLALSWGAGGGGVVSILAGNAVIPDQRRVALAFWQSETTSAWACFSAAAASFQAAR